MGTNLHAAQHIRKMRGGAQAHLMRASDNTFWVVKYQNNPQGLRILANEMLATRLGQWLGLAMPQVEVIEVSDWLIEHTPELRIQIADSEIPCSSGKQLASRYPDDPAADVFDYLPESMLMKVSNLKDFVRILVLDKWAANCDGRQAVFSRKARARSYSATFIDQGYCMNACEWTFPDAALRGVYGRNCVYEHVTGWDAFEPALTKAEEADPLDIWRCADPIPPEWYGHDFDALEQVVGTLYQRRNKIRELIEAFRNSSRNPFPNWKESEAVSVVRQHPSPFGIAL